VIGLRFQRSIPRYVAARALGKRAPGLATQVAPLRLGHYDDPTPPADGWVRVAPRLGGICGSDLAMVAGEASFYFSPIISMPFVPGHEVVGTLLDAADGIPEGTRVVLEPVLACAARGLPPCEACARGETGLCRRTAHGCISPGLQTGFCEDTGGGWGTLMVAHSSQVHAVPDELSDEAAVLVEPLACAVHAVLRAGVGAEDTVVVMGAGTMGLLTVLALRELASPARILAIAKHPRQRREAQRLGADTVAGADGALRAVRLATGSVLFEPERGQAWLDGGADVTFECTGSAPAFDSALRATRPRGRVVLVGLPGPSRIDLAPVWHRELEVVGAYTYGTEADGRRTFDIAIDIAQRVDLAPLVSAAYPLGRWAEAIDHASDAGRLDAVKIVFDHRTTTGGAPARRPAGGGRT
jgi:threonine dehydrogenase-like Zn-dependent dehydrogenase